METTNPMKPQQGATRAATSNVMPPSSATRLRGTRGSLAGVSRAVIVAYQRYYGVADGYRRQSQVKTSAMASRAVSSTASRMVVEPTRVPGSW
jgi:hypothetical protein